ncbi:ladderlectin-like isoform X3 [Onychostoma macrolepis]|uniref:ladderlectin-like isoform X3 n=1 Tax=Onychostoma macrolepis TaxID=369639 RepID=UPI00272D3F8B|nr:ladderlectin-like isoform X3 [Onychostoma macrolepis]
MAVWSLCLSFFLLFALDAAGATPLNGTSNGTTPLNGTSNETIDLYTKIDGKCAPTGGCLWSAYDCRCFRFFSCGTSWIDAEKQCLDYNGHLASVHTNAEYTFIQNLIKSQTRASTEAWIGGYGSVSSFSRCFEPKRLTNEDNGSNQNQRKSSVTQALWQV